MDKSFIEIKEEIPTTSFNSSSLKRDLPLDFVKEEKIIKLSSDVEDLESSAEHLKYLEKGADISLENGKLLFYFMVYSSF